MQCIQDNNIYDFISCCKINIFMILGYSNMEELANYDKKLTIRYKAAIRSFEDKVEWHTLEILTKNVVDFQPM